MLVRGSGIWWLGRHMMEDEPLLAREHAVE